MRLAQKIRPTALPNYHKMTASINHALKDGAAKLESAGIENPRMEARMLMGFAIAGGPEKVLAERDRKISETEMDIFSQGLNRRCSHEPMAYITGTREFYSLSFIVSPATLIPRPDSETVIEAVLNNISDKKSKDLKILDLGTGSGCLLLTLLSEIKNASGIGIDISNDALEIASQNAVVLGLSARANFLNVNWQETDWIKKLGGKFDLIISNPPYISDEELKSLDVTVRDFEPLAALGGGVEGLDSYGILIGALSELLNDDGIVAFEVGHKQAHIIADLLVEKDLQVIEIREDLSGIERAVLAQKINP
ncbi:MAG: peptide chain release factor N(5)-glutamine methyltransferase [Rhodospirillaceae bacterium]|nr:peptide chain release factor N(5)-glutamine methyltransferase [Rhodospirillaceae bacterium]